MDHRLIYLEEMQSKGLFRIDTHKHPISSSEQWIDLKIFFWEIGAESIGNKIQNISLKKSPITIKNCCRAICFCLLPTRNCKQIVVIEEKAQTIRVLSQKIPVVLRVVVIQRCPWRKLAEIITEGVEHQIILFSFIQKKKKIEPVH